MAWSEQQQQMLRAMGLRLWVPGAALPVKHSSPSSLPQQAPDAPTLARPTAPVVAIHEPAPTPATRDASQLADPQRAPHIATLDWPALRAAVQNCTACVLCQGRNQTVFGAGHVRAHWMVVGEAPGEQEDAQGEPFVGAAGHLLDNMLRALSLSRVADDEAEDKSIIERGDDKARAQRAYIVNTLKCRPPRNRNPQAQELLSCEPFLMRQIALVQPRIILAMGRFAVQALLRSSEPIGKLRGRVHRYQGVPLVVTYHPAYLLRNLSEKARAWEDLCLAASTVGNAGAGAANTAATKSPP